MGRAHPSYLKALAHLAQEVLYKQERHQNKTGREAADS